MGFSKLLESWPALRQLREGDPLGLGKAVQSPRSKTLSPRIDEADHVVPSVCPYCAVGCGQLVYVKDGEVSHIEGDPASPISRGRLCPKGQASKSYKRAKEALLKADSYAYRDRRNRKRDFRRLWIVRINAAARQEGMSYSQFMHGLKEAGIEVDRKVLADIAVRDPEMFRRFAEKAREAVPA